MITTLDEWWRRRRKNWTVKLCQRDGHEGLLLLLDMEGRGAKKITKSYLKTRIIQGKKDLNTFQNYYLKILLLCKGFRVI